MIKEVQSAPLKTIAASEFEFVDFDRSIDAKTLRATTKIVDAVRTGGEESVRKYARKFGERTEQQPLFVDAAELQSAALRIDSSDLKLLQRVAGRIRLFAAAQLGSLSPLTFDVPGGIAGHTIEPVERVGCYAPAGRFPLPSTVLMTAVTAKVAGCKDITLATPDPSDLMLAAAHVVGCNRVLAVGGAHAIAAMAYGTQSMPACDLICGPGSRWVTAAKKIVNGDVGVDMLAGPSELVVIADESSNPKIVAADMLAQAEHDVDARAFLITTHRSVAEAVNTELKSQLGTLSTSAVAIHALQNSAAIVADSTEEAISIADRLAPEHLELHCQDAQSIAAQIRNAGCIFIGHNSAEVFGDYGIGPNHTLPTAGTARWSAGLNVFTFLRIRTWLKMDSIPTEIINDTCRMAELEGLIAHRNASAFRRPNN